MQHQQFPTYGASPWVPGPSDQQQQQQFAAQPQQPQFFVPHQPAAHAGGYGAPAQPAAYGAPIQPAAGTFVPSTAGAGYGAAGPGGMGGMDPFLTGVAGNMLRQQGQSYLQRGQAFMQSKMGFLSGGGLHYCFSINPEYVRTKLLMLLAPFLKRWSYVRVAEQVWALVAGDLYIPLMSIWLYCVLMGGAILVRAGPEGGFRPESIYNSVSSSGVAWLLHTLLLKVLLYMLGIPGAVPFLELAAYAGYPFAAACASLVAQLVTGGGTTYHAVWAYGSLCAAVFLVRTMKRVIFQEARTYSIDSTRHNYLLLGLAILQFPLNAWLARLPAGAAAKAAGKAAAKALL
ncbi:hypothetical protein CHLNCDRAFT_144674 [Chlorella variabilis]|uniref:Uncharacterized protein n=1 Tax=Chlorella variabilis TaxID=554065 RepID=E1ZCS1_CHLVA|nr:hypothetical protein CHLNCDRAFT_144674 [Chlorella variabilis]EFN56097.1 hypothetical protein CHLNCDRAFT_144674 [Chlorella variabilis]|eukprot:XP_005848199.1 hypothetical protein CHLNCDRAFT_144674 [Chlorella variabilis]